MTFTAVLFKLPAAEMSAATGLEPFHQPIDQKLESCCERQGIITMNVTAPMRSPAQIANGVVYVTPSHINTAATHVAANRVRRLNLIG
jgi:hypothetical protein